MTPYRLPKFKGHAVDFRLREFRRVGYNPPTIEFIPFDSPEGMGLLAEIIREIGEESPLSIGGSIPLKPLHFWGKDQFLSPEIERDVTEGYQCRSVSSGIGIAVYPRRLLCGGGVSRRRVSEARSFRRGREGRYFVFN